MIKHIHALKVTFLEVSPLRHLEASAPQLPVTSDSVRYYVVSKYIF